MTDSPMAPPTVVGVVPEAGRRALWLEARKEVITGTDAGKILTGKAIDVWLEKTGQSPATNDTDLPDYMLAGRYFEQSILRWYADRAGVGLEFQDSYQLHRMVDQPIGATLDARRLDDGRPVDAKNIGIRHPYDADEGHGWGADGSDQIPLYYAAQLVVQMAVTDREAADLAVVFGGNRFATFTVTRDRTVEADLIGELIRWRDDHVVNGKVPKPEGSESFSKYLKTFVRQKTDRMIDADPITADAMAEYVHLKKQAKEIDDQVSALGNQLRAAIGEDVGAIGGGYQATWRKSADGVTIQWEQVAREAWKVGQEVANGFGVAEMPLPFADLTRRFTIAKEGNRPLLVKPLKGAK